VNGPVPGVGNGDGGGPADERFSSGKTTDNGDEIRAHKLRDLPWKKNARR